MGTIVGSAGGAPLPSSPSPPEIQRAVQAMGGAAQTAEQAQEQRQQERREQQREEARQQEQQRQQEAAERAAERQQQQFEALQQVAQAESVLQQLRQGDSALAQQQAALVQQILQILNATPTPSPTRTSITPVPSATPLGNNDLNRIRNNLPPPPANAPSCASRVGEVCQLGGDLSGSTGRVVGSMQWRIVVPTDRISPGVTAVVAIATDARRDGEFITCPRAVAGQPTICEGATMGNAIQGGTVGVYVNSVAVVQGTTVGPGSGPVGTGQMRISLIWGTPPQDLDAHLWTPP
jgi:hypothetical protein